MLAHAAGLLYGVRTQGSVAISLLLWIHRVGETVWILVSWFYQEPADLVLQYFKKRI